MFIRLCKTALVIAMALFFSLVALGNATDYESNWQFVQHVLSMDTTFPNSILRWRAITNPSLQISGYLFIIGVEAVTALLLWVGSALLLSTVLSSEFNRLKHVAIGGLSLGFLLYSVGFITIGGEWFAMWQSQIWNGEQKAFYFLTMIGVVLIFLLQPDHI